MTFVQTYSVLNIKTAWKKYEIIYFTDVLSQSYNTCEVIDYMIREKTCCPAARAAVHGSSDHPDLRGTVTFKQMSRGVLVTAEICGLPYVSRCGSGIFALHIHNGTGCTGNAEDAFADADGHYNPEQNPHPYHAGDLPPLFGNHGYAYMSVLTDRFTVEEIIGRVIIIHSQPDDFKTQPAGNAGTKIACGKILGI